MALGARSPASRLALAAIGEGLFELGFDAGAPHGPLRRGYGGDAANTAVMAARLGVPARLCGRVGDEALGRLLMAFWSRAGVETGYVVIDAEAPTGIYVNERTPTGHRFDYHRRSSAGTKLSPADVSNGFLSGIGALHTTGVTLALSQTAADATALATERARGTGALISFAVNYRAPLAPDPATLFDAARDADIVFVSREDAEAVLGASGEEKALAALERRPGEVVLTAGAAGAVVAVGEDGHAVAAPPIDVLDAAGTGDALAGAYLAERLAGRDPRAALAVGVAASVLSCGAYGCAMSYPAAGAVQALASELA